MAPFIAKMMKLSLSTPEKIAKKIHQVIESQNPPLRVPATLDAYFFDLLRRLVPRGIYQKISYWYDRPTNAHLK
jgi:hypothetical protein